MTASPHTDLRCAREGCNLPSGAACHLTCLPNSHAFVAPQAPEAPRPPITSNTAKHDPCLRMLGCIFGRNHLGNCSPALHGDAETTPAPTPITCCSHCGTKVFATLSRARYQCCGCGTIWTDTEAAPELDLSSAPLDSGPRAEPPLGTCNMDSAFHAKTCGCIDWTPAAASPQETPAGPASEPTQGIRGVEDDTWMHAECFCTEDDTCRYHVALRDLATQGRSLAALRSALDNLVTDAWPAVMVVRDSGRPLHADGLQKAVDAARAALTETQPT